MGVSSRPVVTITDGKLMGRKAVTSSGTSYFQFKGIPYAKPPLGDLRFMPPEPPQPWDGVRDASYERHICSQPPIQQRLPMPSSRKEMKAVLHNVPAICRVVRGILTQSEDCLYLNVYTPRLPTEESGPLHLPVLFWIHGGAYLVGSGHEDLNGVDLIVDRGVVVVSINYRLGPLGFLCLDTDSAPGNAGMKDQVQALRWVRDNIAQFGGDRDRVTAYGVSAGGASAHLLTVSPLAKGLLHRAIAGSGVATSDWSVATNHVKRATEFAKLIGIEAATPEELAVALKKVSVGKIVKGGVNYALHGKEMCLAGSIPFVPCLERPREGAFLAEHPEALLREGRQAPVPFISGVTMREGIVFFLGMLGMPDVKIRSNNKKTLKSAMKVLDQHRDRFIPPDLHEVLSEEQRQQVGDLIVERYCGPKGLCKETQMEFIDLVGDLIFVIKFIRALQLHCATSAAPVYMYRFVFNGRIGPLKQLFKQDFQYTGSGHGDDLSYFIPPKVLPSPPVKSNEPEFKVREKFINLFVNFIKTGEPTPQKGADHDVGGITWQPVTETTMDYLEISSECEMKQDKFGPRFQFWDDLYKKYLNKPVLW